MISIKIVESIIKIYKTKKKEFINEKYISIDMRFF